MNELTKSVTKRTTRSSAVMKLLLCVSLVLVGAFSATVLAGRHSTATPHEHGVAALDGNSGPGGGIGSSAGSSRLAFAGKCLWQMVTDIRETLTSTAFTVMAGLIDGATTFTSWTNGVVTKAIEGFVALAATLCAAAPQPTSQLPYLPRYLAVS